VTALYYQNWTPWATFSVADTMGLPSVNLTQLAPNAAVLCEITRNDVHWAVQGHSRSPIFVPVESPLCDFLLVSNNSNLCAIWHRFPVTAAYWSNYRFWQWLPLFNSFVYGAPFPSELRNSA